VQDYSFKGSGGNRVLPLLESFRKDSTSPFEAGSCARLFFWGSVLKEVLQI
jgi:hypothetical protein